jgi:ectoine hydroxylase-related dioxygenase (phytanoyl-CoA dioxygenase family)
MEPMVPDLSQELFEIETYGFTLLTDVLSAAQAADLRAVNERLLAAHGDDLVFHGRAGHIANLPTRDPAYFPCIDHPRVLPLIEAMMGRDLILASLNSRVVRPGEAAQGFHSDVPPQLRRPGPPIMMNTVWMLDTFTEANGATAIVVGSHRSDLCAPPPEREVRFVHRAVGPPGSVLVFDGRCWHAGGANRTQQARHGLFGHYRVAPWIRFQCDPHRGFPEEWFERLTPRQKELLRMQKGLGHPTSSDYDEV